MFKNTAFEIEKLNWNPRKAVNMSYMFADSMFNGDINSWDVSNVEEMQGMFANNISFNKPLSNWNTKKCNDMSYMF